MKTIFEVKANGHFLQQHCLPIVPVPGTYSIYKALFGQKICSKSFIAVFFGKTYQYLLLINNEMVAAWCVFMCKNLLGKTSPCDNTIFTSQCEGTPTDKFVK